MALQSPAIRLLAERSANGRHSPDQEDSQNVELSSSSSASAAAAKRDNDGARRFYTSAQWTADGTSILTTSSDNTVSSFVLPADLLQPAGDARRLLHPQASVKLPEPAQAIAAAPYFSLADPASQIFLAGCRDHPLHIYHAFPAQDAAAAAAAAVVAPAPAPLYTYKLIRKETEEYIMPASLLWEYPGTHFVVGSANRLDCFDLSRHGSDGPMLSVPTIPSKRHVAKGGGVGMKGTVSALASSSSSSSGSGGGGGGDGIIAAGTWTRWMGLYDLRRTDRVVANWSVAGAAAAAGLDTSSTTGSGSGEGQGIAQTAWSPCGRYLVVNERQADGLLVYDVRGTGQLLSVLRGRRARTQQRLRCDVFRGGEGAGFEVWAGGQDGCVAVWEGVGTRNEVAGPSWTWEAHGGSPVGSAAVHASGSVVATCSGGWEHPSEEHVDRRVLDEASLKVWSVGGQDSKS